MRFSPKQFAILADYHRQKLTLSPIFKKQIIDSTEAEDRKELLDALKTLGQKIFQAKHFYYVATPIALRLINDQTLKDKLFDLSKEVESESGVLLMPKIGTNIMKYFCYEFDNKGDTCHYKIAFATHRGIDGFIIGKYFNKSEDKIQDYLKATLSDDLLSHNNVNIEEFAGGLRMLVLFNVLFKQYASIETKIIQKGKPNIPRKITLNQEKYLNETPVPIQIIDSNWFTNIIRTTGFTVRGHFALRAYGEGRKKRRLVWIDTYQKSGYERKARRLQV